MVKEIFIGAVRKYFTDTFPPPLFESSWINRHPSQMEAFNSVYRRIQPSPVSSGDLVIGERYPIIKIEKKNKRSRAYGSNLNAIIDFGGFPRILQLPLYFTRAMGDQFFDDNNKTSSRAYDLIRLEVAPHSFKFEIINTNTIYLPD